MAKQEQAPPPLDGRTVFKLLASPTRLRLLLLLDERGEVAVCDLAGALGRSQPAVSHELALLLGGRLVARQRDGPHVLYRLASPAVADVLRLISGT